MTLMELLREVEEPDYGELYCQKCNNRTEFTEESLQLISQPVTVHDDTPSFGPSDSTDIFYTTTIKCAKCGLTVWEAQAPDTLGVTVDLKEGK